MRNEPQDICRHERRLEKLLKIIGKGRYINATTGIAKCFLLLFLLLPPFMLLFVLLLTARHYSEAMQIDVQTVNAVVQHRKHMPSPPAEYVSHWP